MDVIPNESAARMADDGRYRYRHISMTAVSLSMSVPPSTFLAPNELFDPLHKLPGICARQRPASGHVSDGSVPLDTIKVSSWAPVGASCGLYSSVKM